MSESTTRRAGLPLLQPAQAQKHVTVNDALMRLDGLVNLVLQSVVTPVAPDIVTDGECWAVPAGAGGVWTGQDGRIAIGANGGWVFAEPQRGQQAFLRDAGVLALWTGSDWAPGAVTMGRSGAGLSAGITEGDVEIGAGTSVDSGVFIPANDAGRRYHCACHPADHRDDDELESGGRGGAHALWLGAGDRDEFMGAGAAVGTDSAL